MIKWMLATLLLIIGLPVFSEETSNEFHHPLQEWQNEALVHFSYGNTHLLLHEPWKALEQFQRANSLLDKSDGSSCPIGFLITFGQVIAYDCLGFHDQCKQAVGSLFLNINEYNDEDDPLYEEDECSQTTCEESKIALQFLQNLAILAPSSEVRELLFSLIEDMAEELLPAFQFADPLPLGGDLSFSSAQDDYSTDLCKRKSFWKKFRKWCAEVRDWLQDVVKIIKGAKDVKDAYEQWKKSNQYNGMSYEGFRNYHNKTHKRQY